MINGLAPIPFTVTSSMHVFPTLGILTIRFPSSSVDRPSLRAAFRMETEGSKLNAFSVLHGQISDRKAFVALYFLRDMIRLEYGLNSNQHAYFLSITKFLTPAEVGRPSGRNRVMREQRRIYEKQ